MLRVTWISNHGFGAVKDEALRASRLSPAQVELKAVLVCALRNWAAQDYQSLTNPELARAAPRKAAACSRKSALAIEVVETCS